MGRRFHRRCAPREDLARGVDAFVRTYDSGGKHGWARQFGSTGTDDATSVSVTPGTSYVGGFTDGALPEQTSAVERMPS